MSNRDTPALIDQNMRFPVPTSEWLDGGGPQSAAGGRNCLQSREDARSAKVVQTHPVSFISKVEAHLVLLVSADAKNWQTAIYWIASPFWVLWCLDSHSQDQWPSG